MAEQCSLWQPQFDGEPVSRADHTRLASQQERVRDFLLKGGRWTLMQIAEATGVPPTTVGSRVRDLRKEKWGGYRVMSKRLLDDCGTWVYWIEI